jgi:hypothetical protein
MFQTLVFTSLAISQGQLKPPVEGPNLKLNLIQSYDISQEDYLVAPGPAYEISAASLRPDRSFKNKIVLSVGAPLALYLLTADNSKLSTGAVIPMPSIDKTYLLTDNQVVRLESNELLMERDSSTFRAFAAGSAPAWAKESVTCMGKTEVGHRGGISLLNSSDGMKWAERKLIDFGTQFTGKYGIPRAMDNAGVTNVAFDKQGKNADGTKKWWIGGGDRTEVYACPFTGNLYVCTRVISGPYTDGGASENTTLVLGSTDRGATWSLIGTHAAWSPTVMTSTQDGRLWMFQEVGTNPVLRVTAPTSRLVLPKGTITSATIKSNDLPAEGPDKVDMENKIGQPGIARLSGSAQKSEVLLSYQIRNTSGNQEYKILKAAINSKSEITSTTIDTVYAEGRNANSALYGAFIQPELVGESTLRHANDDVLFYWYKARRDGIGKYAVQYAIYEAGKRTQGGFLSTLGAAKREWDTRKDPGDYIKGASYYGADGVHRFVPFWVEPDGVHAAVLSKRPKSTR